MYTALGTATLSSGETLHCGVVHTPDPAWAPRIRPFLAHKRPEWRAHIEASLERPLDALDTLFYVGTAGSPDGPIVTCVMVASARGAGLLGYVFTAPEWRGRGAYTALMGHQMDHCRTTRHRVLTLTTNPTSGAYRIYHRFGFRPVEALSPEHDPPSPSGRMKWLAYPDAERDWFAPAPLVVHPLAWDDWPTLNLTALRVPAPDEPPEELPRSWALHLLTHFTAEGTFPQLHPEWGAATGQRPRERTRHAVTLRSETGAVAGWLFVRPDPLTFESAGLVDLYLHPAFVDRGAPLLVEALRSLPPEITSAPLTAYLTAADGYRARILEAAGFSEVATLPSWLPHEGTSHDIHVFSRPAS